MASWISDNFEIWKTPSQTLQYGVNLERLLGSCFKQTFKRPMIEAERRQFCGIMKQIFGDNIKSCRKNYAVLPKEESFPLVRAAIKATVRKVSDTVWIQLYLERRN
jgi:hypothetical protein